MAKSVLGYNIGIRIIDGSDEKFFVGTTSNTFSIEPQMKESITKDDKGSKRSKKTGYTFNFSVEALSMVNEAGDLDTLDRDDIIDLALATEDAAEIEFYYGPLAPGSKVRKGKAVMGTFSESSDSENEATLSINFTGTGTLVDYTIPQA